MHCCFLCLAFLLGLASASCQPKVPQVTLAFLGDINLGRGVSPDADSFTALSTDLAEADLALANLESPLSALALLPAPLDSYNLCAPAGHANLLATWGLDLLALANNHADDCAPDGLEASQVALSDAGLTAMTATAHLRTLNGLSLAFLAFDDVASSLDVEAALQAIRLARASGALVIVSVHWGAEYQGAPTGRQIMLAGQFASAGATLIWGHHPHVLQPASWIDSTLVLYSLGNALFDQGGLETTRQSALVLVTLGSGGVQAVTAVPFEIDVPHSRLTLPDALTSEQIRVRLDLK